MPPTYQPPPGYPPPPAGYAPPTGSVPPATGYLPATYAGAAVGVGIMSQFGGIAAWSIILGVVSIGVPIVTGLTTGGTVTYFYVLPIFGVIRGFVAVTRGKVLGGVVGIVLNVIGGLISLLASGVFFH
jgi:hypothetical protein